MKEKLEVAINAQILPNQGSGGAESVLIGLIRALGRLEDGPEKYTLICDRRDPDWLKPYLGPNQRIVTAPGTESPPGPGKKIRKLIRKFHGPWGPFLGRAWRVMTSGPAPKFEVPWSDGFYESLGAGVIHFPYQVYELCALPSVYNPHDLQHRHYPQYFTSDRLAWREKMYRTGCRYADTVAVASRWVKQDLVDNYRLNPDKIQVIPWAPPTQAYSPSRLDDLGPVREKYRLDGGFALYPAMTWEHKNHLRLLEALDLLRSRDKIRINLVCTGHQNDFWKVIREKISALRLEEQVKFLGIVPGEDLRAIYRLSKFVVIPTLFEAASGPLFEAWQEGAPAACSNVTSLPEQAQDAALIFDPFSVEDIAGALKQMETDPGLRGELARRGKMRLQKFDWVKTAKAYRAVYRRAARRKLGEEDLWLLQNDWTGIPGPSRHAGDPS